MKSKSNLKALLAGFLAGIVNGLLGAGGGMILIPLLSRCPQFKEDELFSVSVSVMLSLSLVTLLFAGHWEVLSYPLLPCYLLGSCFGGILAGKKSLPLKWLHRILGVMILTGGIHFLC